MFLRYFIQSEFIKSSDQISDNQQKVPYRDISVGIGINSIRIKCGALKD